MNWKLFFGVIFFLVVFILLVVYWFVPYGEVNFRTGSGNPNFSAGNFSSEAQFYKNMRFPDSKISYKIYDCPIQKRNDMERAFEIISNLTVLDFYPVNSIEEISVFCDNKIKIEEGLFIAGEGGPTNITRAGEFNVIFSGSILLLKDSSCSDPNIAIHELLHVLGFEHSSNSNNIMYPVSNCRQTIGDDTISLINELYSIEKNPDLVLENVSAILKGKYLDTNITLRNNGFEKAEKSKVLIYVDGKLEKEIEVKEIEVGFGTTITLTNLWISQFSAEEFKFFIDYENKELDKKNNELILKIKEN